MLPTATWPCLGIPAATSENQNRKSWWYCFSMVPGDAWCHQGLPNATCDKQKFQGYIQIIENASYAASGRYAPEKKTTLDNTSTQLLFIILLLLLLLLLLLTPILPRFAPQISVVVDKYPHYSNTIDLLNWYSYNNHTKACLLTWPRANQVWG